MRTGLYFGLLLLFAACDVHAIYEEQAGENDWHAEFIGQATATHVVSNDRLAVATKSNVVALLSASTGDIIWRQVLHTSDQLQEIAVLNKPAAVLSLSSSATVLRNSQMVLFCGSSVSQHIRQTLPLCLSAKKLAQGLVRE